MVVVAKELINKLRTARKLKIEAQRPKNEVALYEFDKKAKVKGQPRELLTGRQIFEREVAKEAPYSGRKVWNTTFYDKAVVEAPSSPTVPMWQLSLRMTRNNAFVTMIDTQQKNRLLYWASARTGNLTYSVMKSPGRITDMLVPALVKAMAEGAQLKYLVFRGTFRYTTRVLRSIKRRGIPVWHIMMNVSTAHNGCRRRKQVRK